MSKTIRPIGYIYSFDIETNQYYDYSTWQQVPALDDDDAAINGGDRVFATIKNVVAKYAAALPQSCLEGSKVASDAYNEIVSEIRARNPQATAEQVDSIKLFASEWLDKYFPHVPTKTETYLATFVCIPWYKLQPDKSKKYWYEHSADDLKTMLKNAHTYVCKSNKDINDVFEKIYDEGKDLPNIVLIHNLSYEFNNCIRSLPFFKKMVQENKVKYLSNNAVDSIKSMEIYNNPLKQGNKARGRQPAPCIYFRDTWKLTNMSIDKLGAVHKFPKLPYEYGIIRDPATLTQEDYDYNRRDCDIAILGFHDAWTQATDILNLRYLEHGSVPVSANNIISAMSKHNFTAEFEHHKARVQPKSDKNSTTLSGSNYLPYDVYRTFKRVCGGGLVFVNPYFAYKEFEIGKSYTVRGESRFTVEEIGHKDLVSSYPSQAFKRLYPTTAPQKVPETTVPHIKRALEASRAEIMQAATVDGIKNDLDCFTHLTPRLKFRKKNSKDEATSGFAKFTFKNLRARTFNVGGTTYSLPCLWGSKITTTLSGADEFGLEDYVPARGKNLKLCGSKIVSADLVSLDLQFEDFLTVVCLFYEFDSFEISDVYLYAMGMISPYLYQQFAALGEKKNAYKAINKALAKSDVDKAISAAQCKQVLDVHRQLLQDCDRSGEAIATLHELSGTWLSAAKAQFNGVYGSSYQSLERDSSSLEIDTNGEITWNKMAATYDDANASGIDYLQGAYIATWGRVDIALYTYVLATNGAVPLYIATDSVYYLVTEYTNKELPEVLGFDLPAEQFGYRAFNKQSTEMAAHRKNIPMVGGMDSEAPIEVIGYTQALKLICREQVANKATGELEGRDVITFSGTCAEKSITTEDGDTEKVGFFADCNDIHEKIQRLFQENGLYTRYDIYAKNKKTPGSCDAEGAYELVGQMFANNSTEDKNYLCRKSYAEFMDIKTV